MLKTTAINAGDRRTPNCNSGRMASKRSICTLEIQSLSVNGYFLAGRALSMEEYTHIVSMYDLAIFYQFLHHAFLCLLENESLCKRNSY